ncbi:MAG: cbiQ [Clostridiales bacterium]|nr:cbiQ [Clostridiales bacterium]
MYKELTGIQKAKLKIITCIVLVLMLSLLQSLLLLTISVVLLITILALYHRKINVRLKTIIAIIIFAAMLGLIQIFTIGTQVIYSKRISFFTLNLYKEGFDKGLISFLKISGSMGAVIMLMRSIKMGEFIEALKWFRLPTAFIEVLTFAVKFIYIFKDEAASIIKAQRARLGYKSFYISIISMSSVAGIVLTRAYDRSKMLSKSMKCRGYNGYT